MNHLFVWMTLPQGTTLKLGELVFADMQADGTAITAFRYAPEWLSHPGAFPLTPDPQMLPLQAGEFQASNLGFPLRVFDDALPDDWGRRLIVAEHRLSKHQQGPFWIMQAVAGQGLGALTFSGEDVTPERRTAASRHLKELAEAAIAFDAGQPLAEAALRRLFTAGATPGGARPKALVVKNRREWIAKFPSPWRDRGQDVVGLEATCMKLAHSAGLDVPEVRLEQLGARRAVLIERFDISPSGGRHHMISLATLCRGSGGSFAHSYDTPAEIVRKFSDDLDDVARFFRQMVFNAAIGNTDDHLKNFAMIRTSKGYRLSPAFDLVPDVNHNRDHTLAIGREFFTPNAQTLMEIGRHWLGHPARAQVIIDEVIHAVSQFHVTAEQLEVAPESITTFTADIERRIAIMSH